MLYELADTSKVNHLFEGWKETLIYSCLQKVMGKIFVMDPDSPVSAMTYVGCFAFYAGVPDKELVRHKPDGFVIMTPQNEKWADCIEECFPDAKKVSRYAQNMISVHLAEKLGYEYDHEYTAYEVSGEKAVSSALSSLAAD